MDKDKELVVLDLMMAVHLKLQSAQSMVTVNVLHTNLEILNVVLALRIQLQTIKCWRNKSVDKDRELAVRDLMTVVHLKLLSVQNGVIVNVQNISLGDLSVDLDFL